MKSLKPLVFEPILSPRAGSYAALQIRPPGTWMGNNKQFHVFVGGCGHGKRRTLESAKKLLLREGLAYCDERIAQLRIELLHYERERDQLLRRGLKAKRSES